ncbi:transcription factor E2F5-like [Ambystoma mexicanum]|uniref:transcription factor E2F5-like n=1 Tax=Ambystoma mexicanum TaxID=8296 RepID=UPI0037E90D8F
MTCDRRKQPRVGFCALNTAALLYAHAGPASPAPEQQRAYPRRAALAPEGEVRVLCCRGGPAPMSGPRKLAAFARNEKALGLLSCRLMSLLREAEGGAMDVDAATVALALTRKRRIYDVICVLEGIGLIEKKANFIQLKDVDGCNTKSALGRRKILEAEIQDLDLEEKELNKQIFLLDQSIQGIMEEPSMKIYLFCCTNS